MAEAPMDPERSLRHKARPKRTPVELNDYERQLIDQARGDTPLGMYMRQAALARAAAELGRRGAQPIRAMHQFIALLRRETHR